MTITIRLKTENAAFTDNPTELRDVLKDAVQLVVDGGRRAPLRDSNGNTIGSIVVTGR